MKELASEMMGWMVLMIALVLALYEFDFPMFFGTLGCFVVIYEGVMLISAHFDEAHFSERDYER